jgi:hypothetical protein
MSPLSKGRLRGREVIGALLLPGFVFGCGATCDRNLDEPPVRHTGGTTDLAAGFYESAPWEGPYLSFPAGRTYEFIHGLGGRPREVTTYLSFQRCPLSEPCEPGDDEQSNVTIGVGNQALIDGVDDERILVRNDTCSTIWLRVTAESPERSQPVENDGGM